MITCPRCSSSRIEKQTMPGFFVRRIDYLCIDCGNREFQGGGTVPGSGVDGSGGDGISRMKIEDANHD